MLRVVCMVTRGRVRDFTVVTARQLLRFVLCFVNTQTSKNRETHKHIVDSGARRLCATVRWLRMQRSFAIRHLVLCCIINYYYYSTHHFGIGAWASGAERRVAVSQRCASETTMLAFVGNRGHAATRFSPLPRRDRVASRSLPRLELPSSARCGAREGVRTARNFVLGQTCKTRSLSDKPRSTRLVMVAWQRGKS